MVSPNLKSFKTRVNSNNKNSRSNSKNTSINFNNTSYKWHMQVATSFCLPQNSNLISFHALTHLPNAPFMTTATTISFTSCHPSKQLFPACSTHHPSIWGVSMCMCIIGCVYCLHTYKHSAMDGTKHSKLLFVLFLYL